MVKSIHLASLLLLLGVNAAWAQNVRPQLLAVMMACEASVSDQSLAALDAAEIGYWPGRIAGSFRGEPDVGGEAFALFVSVGEGEATTCTLRQVRDYVSVPYREMEPTVEAWARQAVSTTRETYFDPGLAARVVYDCWATRPYRAIAELTRFSGRERTLARGQGIELPEHATALSLNVYPIDQNRCAAIDAALDEHDLRGT